MKKMPTLFVREGLEYRATTTVTPSCQWVIDGEGTATEKFDGTCCLVEAGRLWKRRDRKRGRVVPDGWVPAQPEPDPVTGHWPGWLAVGSGPEDRWHREALAAWRGILADGTYELLGPKVQSNCYDLFSHSLYRHGLVLLPIPEPLSWDVLQQYLASQHIEGVVWHHSDGRMAKLKRRDFGLAWPCAPIP